MKGFLLLIVAAVGSVNAVCNFPPSLWCSSAEIATQCKVYEQCKESVWTTKSSAPLVQFELYYESLCPDCRQFWASQLFPTYEQIGTIMNITVVPYGNAEERRVGDMWEFTCQHGKQECIGNVLETCAINSLQTMDKIIPFIHCMEAFDDPMKAVVTCGTQLQVDVSPIMSCANSTQGNQLEHQMALKTDALVPPHRYVPWVTLNGVHTEEINDEAVKNLLKLICDAYTGTKPSACTAAERTVFGCRRTDLI